MRPIRVIALFSALLLSTACESDVVQSSDVRLTSSDASLTDVQYRRLSQTQRVALGKRVFFDKTLSANKTQSCSSCHAPGMGWGGPDAQARTNPADRSFIEGDIPGSFGGRKSPSAAYASFSPLFFWEAGVEMIYRGGQFWDGRATGYNHPSQNPLAEQGLGPFLSTAEHGFGNLACVVYRVQNTPGNYYRTFLPATPIRWSGFQPSWCDAPTSASTLAAKQQAIAAWITTSRNRINLEQSWNNVANALAAYQSSPEVNAFSSNWDRGVMTADARRGEALFLSANCVACHVTEVVGLPVGAPVQLIPGRAGAEIFTDHSYYNLGLPANRNNPAIQPPARDLGLGAFLQRGKDNWAQMRFPGTFPAEPEAQPAMFMGTFKTPTVRNLTKGGTKTYMHNGVLKTLEQVVHFYNTRDVKQCGNNVTATNTAYAAIEAGQLPACWPAPEVGLAAGDVNNIFDWGFQAPFVGPDGLIDLDVVGNLGLTPAQELQLVAFLRALDDRNTVVAP